MYNGLINVYKEPGFTSFDVVAVLRGILKQKKIGHTGTLDPAAEGVLLVCLGSGTKLVDLLENRDKEYECRMLLGTTTDTEDTTGQVLETKEVNCNEEQIREVVKHFIGEIDQIPPMYSAIKKDGKKLYELAREGKEVVREARKITIYEISVDKIELPYVTMTIKCGKGTYIRSLCRDIGEKLGCGACMEHLKRTKVSYFGEAQSLKLSQIEKIAKEERISEYVLPVESVFEKYEALHVKTEAKKYIDNGNPLEIKDVITDFEKPVKDELYKVYNAEGKFVAIYRFDEDKNLYMPKKMFLDE